MITQYIQRLDQIRNQLNDRNILESKIALVDVQQEMVNFWDQLSSEESALMNDKILELGKQIKVEEDSKKTGKVRRFKSQTG